MKKTKNGPRPYAWEKIQFLEDANEDSRIPKAAYRVLQKICTAYNRENQYAECARNFIVDRVPVSVKTVQRARKLLISEQRIFIVREPVGRASTRFGVNWWFRGADAIRFSNAGKPILDCRIPTVEGTLVSTVEGTSVSASLDSNVPSTDRRGDMVSSKPYLSPTGNKYATCAAGALPFGAAPPAVAILSVEVLQASVSCEDGETTLELTMSDGAEEYEDSFTLQSGRLAKQDDGQARFAQLLQAADLHEIDHPEELVGVKFDISNDGDVTYIPADPIRRQTLGYPVREGADA